MDAIFYLAAPIPSEEPSFQSHVEGTEVFVDEDSTFASGYVGHSGCIVA